MSNWQNKGVFKFVADYETRHRPHLLRLRVDRHHAREMAKTIIQGLYNKDTTFEFDMFGTLTRDAEEDPGLEVPVEGTNEEYLANLHPRK